jgi:hypothetical protein
MYPDRFKYPISSLEAKKDILGGMTPMLAEAESVRKADIDRCEQFTRCRVEKSRLRSASYQYIDIDTDLVVSSAEYSRR